MFAQLAVLFDGADRPEVAATIWGTSTQPARRSHRRRRGTRPASLSTFGLLGDAVFEQCAATGAGMELGEAVAYARHHIRTTRTELATS